MNHDQMREKIYAFHDNELPEQERREMEAHLNNCAECRGELDGWSKIAAAFLRPAEANIHSEAFVSRVMAHLDDSQSRSPSSVIWRNMGLGLGFAAAFLMFSFQTNTPVTIEELLLADSRAGAMTAGTIPPWVFEEQAIQNDDLLSYALEER